jgi:hypothetical protein
MSEEVKSIETILEDLSKSPMFNLSLSDKELFHSNMLGWIFETYPVFFHTLFDTGLVSKVKVEREKNNFDLFITYEVSINEKKFVLIENKVKSIPRMDQLREYKTKNESPKFIERKKPYNDKELKAIDDAVYRSKNTRYVLLSLIKPFWFDLDENTTIWANTWEYLDYAEISNKLIEFLPSINDIYQKSIIDDYSNYVTKLKEIILTLEKETKYLTYNSNILESEEVIEDEVEQNDSNNRFTSQMHKWRAEIHKKELFDSFIKSDSKLKIGYIESWWLAKQNDIGKFYLGSGIASKSKLDSIDYKFVVHISNEFDRPKIGKTTNVHNFGIQIEGRSLRIVLEVRNLDSFTLKVPKSYFRDNQVEIDETKYSFEKSNLWLLFLDNCKPFLNEIVTNESIQGLKVNKKESSKNEMLSYGPSFKYKYFTLKENVSKVKVYEAIYNIHKELSQAILDKDSGLSKYKDFLDKEWK